MTAAGNIASPLRQRLDSWKEIAAFFGRDERTVNRWEKELGLPVHRLPGRAKGPVYAFTDELTAWMTGPSIDTTVTASPAGPLLAPTVPISASDPFSEKEPRRMALGLMTAAWFAAGGILAVACVLAWVLLHAGTSHSRIGKATVEHRSSTGVVHAAVPLHNPEAEQLYLEGRYYWDKRTPADLNKSLDYFTQAVVKDPGYSNAYVGLADCYNLLREYTMMPGSEKAYPRALAAAQRAVELDENSSEAHASVAFASFWGRWDVTTADREFRRSIELDPKNASAHHWYATYLTMVRRLPESLAEIERAQALEPGSKSVLADKGILLFASGKTADSLALLKQLEETEPTFVSPHRYLKTVYFAQGDYRNFLAEWRKEAILVRDDSSLVLIAAAQLGLTTGGANGMLRSLRQRQTALYAKRLVSPYALARTCSMLGERQQTLQYLNTAYTQHDDALVGISTDTAFVSLHNDPAYLDLVARIGLPRN